MSDEKKKSNTCLVCGCIFVALAGLVVVGIVVGLFFVGKQKYNEIKPTIVNFTTALSNNQFDKAYELCTPGMKGTTPLEQFTATMAALGPVNYDFPIQLKSGAGFTISAETGKPTSATVGYVGATFMKGTADLSFALIKTGDIWLVESFKITNVKTNLAAPVPAPSPFPPVAPVPAPNPVPGLPPLIPATPTNP